MFAVHVLEPNALDPLSTLRVGEFPTPEAPSGWVRVKIKAASLNRHDLWSLVGVRLEDKRYPMILGCDGAGTLDDGTDVIIYPVLGNIDAWRPSTSEQGWSVLSEKLPGTFAEYIWLPPESIIPSPAGVSAIAGAVLGTTWLTAYRMIFSKSGLKPGDTMLVQGASGGVATALTQLGRAAGLRVWVTARSAEKRALAERLGAEQSFATGDSLPGPVDAVLDTVGPATWEHSVSAVRSGGTVVLGGITTGFEANTSLLQILVKQARIIASAMGSLQEMHSLIEFMDVAGIIPEIGQILPMDEAAKGFQSMHRDEVSGKIVFTL